MARKIFISYRREDPVSFWMRRYFYPTFTQRLKLRTGAQTRVYLDVKELETGDKWQRDLRSALDEVPGVGPRRRKTLLTRFGSLAGVRRATREELTAVVGTKAADAIVEHFARV